MLSFGYMCIIAALVWAAICIFGWLYLFFVWAFNWTDRKKMPHVSEVPICRQFAHIWCDDSQANYEHYTGASGPLKT